MRVILLNGPPRVGKDSIGRVLHNMLIPAAAVTKFAKPLVDYMWRMYGIIPEDINKDAPHPRLLGRTPREAMIAYSERFCKPLFGQDFFGHQAVSEIQRIAEMRQSLVVFTDSGFVNEAVPVLQRVGKGNVLQVRISRPGCSFHNDSRSYWHHDDIGSIEFDNDCESLVKLTDKVKSDLIPEIAKWSA